MRRDKLEQTKIIQILDRIRRRLGGNYLFSMLLKGLTAGSVAGCLFNLLAVWHPVLWQDKKLIAGFAITIFLFLLYGIFHFPDRQAAAIAGDQCGLKERLLTAYENRENNSAFLQLQRKDALEQAEKIDWKKALPFTYQKKQAIFLCLGLIFVFGSYWIPGMAKETAKEQELVQQEVKKKIKETKTVEELSKKTVTNEEALKALKQQLDKTKQEMKQANSLEELKKAQERLIWKMKKEVEQLKRDGNLDAGEAKELLAQLSEDVFKNWEREIAKGDSEFSGNVDPSSKEEGKGAAEDGNGTSGQSGSENGGGSDQNVGDGKSSENDQGNKNSENLQDQGNSGKDQSGEGQGDQSQQGGNQEKNGQGQGSSGSNQGQSGAGNGTGWNYGSEHGKEEEALKNGSMLSVPQKKGNDAKLNGEKIKSGESQTEKGGAASGYRGDFVPYQEVLEQYTDEAYQKIDQRNYPDNVQEIIKKYFIELNQ